ncbi:MAG TPA: hypothetical protein VIS74_06245, partial [Chthoniobacterales bacterium]
MLPNFILATTSAAVFVYILGQGGERFYTEAWGTLLLSPLIWIRLAPPPLNEWILRACRNGGDVI